MVNKQFWEGKKVLITGNTGFKGSWLTIWLLKLGANVYGISKDIPNMRSILTELCGKFLNMNTYRICGHLKLVKIQQNSLFKFVDNFSA